MHQIQDDVQLAIHNNINQNFGRDLSLVFYDLANYYFETERENNLCKKGVSKEQRKNPIVQMWLLIDHNKIPIIYKLFPWNIYDSKTLFPMVQKIK